MEEWKEYKLGELYDVHNGLSKGGKFFGSGYPFLSFSTVFKNYFLPNELTNLVQSSEKEQANFNIKEGDVFITRTSESADELGMSSVALKDYPNATYNGFTKRLRPKGVIEISSKYIGYYLRSPKFRTNFYKLTSAMSTRASLANNDLLNMIVSIPSLQTQQKIANILSSLDDKIEVNRRINEQLEELAQALFKSWFVNFEPFKDGEFVESELGMIPEGWKVGKLGELCQFKRGKNLLSKNAILGGVPVVAGGLEPSCYHNVSNTKSPVVTISGSGANAGFMRMYHQEVWASDCSYIDSSCRNLLFVYFFLANNRKLLKHAQTGAVQPHVKPSDIHDFDIVIPPLEIIDKFQNLVSSSTIITGNNQKEITNLSNLRDTLLPKLMNGEIEL